MTTITVTTNMNDAFNATSAADPHAYLNALVDQRMQAAGAPSNWSTFGTLTTVPDISVRFTTYTWTDGQA